VNDILQAKLVKRGVPLKGLTTATGAFAGSTVKQKITLQQASDRKAREIVKLVKNSKKKAQASIQADVVRISGKIATLCRSHCHGQAAGFRHRFAVTNYRVINTGHPGKLATTTSINGKRSSTCCAMTSQRSKSNSDATRSRTSPLSPRSANTFAAAASAFVRRSCCSPPNSRYKARRGQARFVVEIIHTRRSSRRHHRRAQIRRAVRANTQWAIRCVCWRRLALHAAFKIAVQERNFRILDVLVELTQQLVEGELSRWKLAADLSARASRSHLSQNGLPVLVCMRVGGILGAHCNQEERLANTDATGIAFQIVMMCSTSPRRRVFSASRLPALRKASTMSVIHALERCTAAERHQIETVLRDRAFNGPLMPMS